MRFYKEVLQRQLEYYMDSIDRTKKKISRVPQESLILWEVAELIEQRNDSYNSLSYEHEGCGLYCCIPPMTPEEFDSLLSDIDDIMHASNYHMDIDYKQPSYINGQKLVYIKDGSDVNIYTTLASTECKIVTTGKMVPETKSECNLIVSK